MSPSDKAKLEPFDIHDESLLRYHFTTTADNLGIPRRDAEVIFRFNHAQIVKHLRNATLRSSQFAAIIQFLEDYID